MSEAFDPYHRWLGIPPSQQPPSHYRLLGLESFEDDPEVILDAAHRQMAHVRTYQLGEQAALSQAVLNQLAAAKACLLDSGTKAEYDDRLRRESAFPELGPQMRAEGTLGVANRELPGRHPAAALWKSPLALGGGAAILLLAVLLALIALSGGQEEQTAVGHKRQPGKTTTGGRAEPQGGGRKGEHTTTTKTLKAVKPPPVRPPPPMRPFVLAPINGQTVEAGKELRVHARVVDPRAARGRLHFRLITAPDGAQVDEQTGELVWTPTPEQGGKRHVFSLEVTDDGSPPRQAAQTYAVEVAQAGRSSAGPKPSESEKQLQGEGPEKEEPREQTHPQRVGQLQRTLSGFQRPPLWLAFSPDGRRLAVASADGMIRLWDLTTGQSRQIPAHNHEAFCVVISCDGRTLASGGGDAMVRLWDARTGQLRRGLTGHESSVCGVALHPNGHLLASASRDGTIRLWSISTGRLQRTLTGHADGVMAVVFSADGRTLVSTSRDTTARLWDPTTGKELRVLKGHAKFVHCAAFSPDGNILATGSGDRTAKLWDIKSARVLHTLPGHLTTVMSVAFSPDGRTLASASRKLKLWDVATGQEVQTIEAHGGMIQSVAFSPDGRTLASGAYDKLVKLWTIAADAR